MVDVRPFRGLRYAVGDLAAVTAPPYDAIDASLSARLRDRHPANVVRLERAEEEAGDGPGADRYARSGATFRSWLDAGVLVPEEDPAVYAYEQTSAEGRQRGVIGALALVPWDSREVLPHERVYPGPVEDRLRLLEALPANTSPVYVLADREPRPVADLLDGLASRPPDAAFTDPDEHVSHRLWVVGDADATAAVAAGYTGERLLMADGHHRYTTALRYRDRHPRRRGADRILAYVVGSRAHGHGPVVRAVHRLVRRLPADALARISDAGVDASPAGREEVAETVAAGGATAGLVTRDGAWLLTAGAAADRLRPSDVPEPVRGLDVTLLHALLTDPLGVGDRVEDLLYTPDAPGALADVDAGRADGLFLVRAVTVEEVRAVAAAGGRMPPKSTSFSPKPRTGLVLRPLD